MVRRGAQRGDAVVSTRSLTLYQALVLSSALLLAVVGLMGWGIHALQQQRLVSQFAGPLLRRAVDQGTAEMEMVFAPIEDRLVTDVGLIRNGVLRPYETERLRDLFLPRFAALPAVGSMMVSDPTGYQLLFMRYDAKALASPLLAAQRSAPASLPGHRQFFTRDVRPEQWGDRSVWTVWDTTGRRAVARWEQPLPGYDPRQRPWHQAAMSRYVEVRHEGLAQTPRAAITWTQVYSLFTTKTPGMTATVAAAGPDGQIVIVAYDLLLEDLTRLTTTTRPTSNGVMFVVDSLGRVVGLPAGMPRDREDVWLQQVDTLGYPVLQSWMPAWRRRGATSREIFTFRSEGDSWWGAFAPFALAGGQNLWIGVALPEADLLAASAGNHLILAVLVGVLLLLGLLMARSMARRIAGPLAELATWSGVAGAPGAADGPLPGPSESARWGLLEVQRLREALYRMQGHLVDQVRALRRSGKDLEASEARFRGTFEQAAVGILHVAPDGRILRANGRMAALLDPPLDDLVARTESDLTDPEDRETSAAMLQDVWRGTRDQAQWEKRYRRHPSGDPVWVQVTASRQLLDGGDGTGYLILVVQDIAIRRQLEEQLRQAQKLEAVGELAGGVAHDFNNLLTAITGYAALAREGLDPSHRSYTDILQIEQAAGRAADMTARLLAFARRQVAVPQPVDPEQLCGAVLRMLRPLIPATIDLIQEPASVPPVRVDPGHLQQVLVNLILNARDAMPYGGSIRLSAHETYVGAGDLPDLPDIAPGRFVCLDVSDTGTGMDASVLERIFEPFFTTKEPGKGTGLGLSMCYGIVRQAGGFIRVQSVVGEGTTFRVALPVDPGGRREEERAPAGPERPSAWEHSTGREVILLAEDEEMIRALAVRTLARLGYRVYAMADGVAAVAWASGWEGTIDLLVTDLIMPNMGGREVAMRLRRDRPGLPVLFISGYADQAASTLRQPGETLHLLHKPFTGAQLAAAVRDMLANHGSAPE